MPWKPDDEFVVTHPSAPFTGHKGKVDVVDLPFPYPVKGTVETDQGRKPCWWRLDEINPPEAERPTEQIEAVTG